MGTVFVTVTTAVSSSVTPSSSVTRRVTVKVPSSGYTHEKVGEDEPEPKLTPPLASQSHW